MSPYELILSPPPLHTELAKIEELDHSGTLPQSVKRRFLSRLEAFMKTAKSTMKRAKKSYKNDFDKKIRPKRFCLVLGI